MTSRRQFLRRAPALAALPVAAALAPSEAQAEATDAEPRYTREEWMAATRGTVRVIEQLAYAEGYAAAVRERFESGLATWEEYRAAFPQWVVLPADLPWEQAPTLLKPPCTLCKQPVDLADGSTWFSVGDDYFHMGCD